MSGGSASAGVASRRVAYRVLRRVHGRGTWGQVALDAELRRSELDQRDRAFAANLAYETLRWQGTLDWALGQVLDRAVADTEEDVLDVLRLGAWQLLRGDVPDRAAVGTAVDVARAELPPRSTGFVNGVLRGLARAREALPWPDEATDEGLGLATAYPPWIVAAARRRFGDDARAVLEAGNDPPGLMLRARVDPAALLAELRHEGVAAARGRWAPEAVAAPGADPGRLAAVGAGRATPQDEASMLVAHAVAGEPPPPAGWRALDVAAAPGGKTTHLAELGAAVVAVDRNPRRLRLVSETTARLHLESRVQLLVADARRPPLPRGVFDAVLVDAPCTGLGVVRRRAELRWRHDEHAPARLAAVQGEMLAAAAPLVRPGGRLVYSVCTWTHDETAAVSRAFLEAQAGRFEVTGVAQALRGAGTAPPGDVGMQLRPDTDDVDGMYVCCFVRTATRGAQDRGAQDRGALGEGEDARGR